MGQIGSLWYNIGSKTTDFEKGLSNSKSKLTAFGNSFQKMAGISLSSAGAIALATKAVQESIEYVMKAVDAYDAYTLSIDNIARATGNQLEEMSRLTQVADDLFISQEQLNQALEIGAKKGLDMSVQGIKNLADEYNSLKTAQEKATLLNDNFGRSGLAMGKLLEQGADGIDSAMESISDSLVVTKESKKLTFEYKESVDALNDAMEGLKYTVAQQAMPALTDLNVVLAELATNVAENDTGLEKYLKVYTTYFPNIFSLLRLGVKGLDDWSSSIITSNGVFDELANAQIEAGASFVDSAYGFVYSAEAITEMGDAAENAIDPLIGIKEQYSSISGLAQDLTSSEEDLLQAETDLAEYINKNPWDTKGIQDRKDKVDELKAEQQSMVDSWLLNVYTQMLTADGDLSESDMNFLLQFQINAGMITQANADKAQSYWDFANDSIAANEALQASIDSMHGKEITITTIYNSLTSGGTNPTRAAQIASGVAGGNIAPTNPRGHATGIDMIVPAGYNNDSYPMRVQTGERVQVTPAGQVGNSDLLTEMQEVRRGISSLPRELSVSIIERINQLGLT